MIGLLPDDRQTAAGVLPLTIELSGMHKSFGFVQAVKGIDLTIASGEIAAFLGPNGAGKTSTIDVILGLSRPTAAGAAARHAPRVRWSHAGWSPR
jgi:ABC-2 type transport system ATP-binding protein